MDNSKLRSETEYLFGLKWADDLPDEVTDEHTDRAASLITEYGWARVFEVWESYLYKKCLAPESVINFSMWFWLYSGQDYPIPEPHKFMAYFYYRINCQVKEYDGDYDMLYSLATNILPKAGYSEADLYLNPYYMPEQDPKILAEVENWRKQSAH